MCFNMIGINKHISALGKLKCNFSNVWTFLQVLLICFANVTLGRQNKCEQIAALASLQDHQTIVETSLHLLAGSWISEGCETRPGPQYILRSYHFGTDGSFNLLQHHYWDDSCSSPKLTIATHGRLHPRKSLVQPGAVNGYPRFVNISVIPQDDKAAMELDRLVTSECPGQYWKSWRKYEEHLVCENRNIDRKKMFNLWVSNNHHTNCHMPTNNNNQRNAPNLAGHISCLGHFKWSFKELDLFKIQLRPILDNLMKHPLKKTMELLLGDIHSNIKERQHYTPTSFQIPLVKQARGEEVLVNNHHYIVKNTNTIPANMYSNGKSPPHLIKKPHLPPYIWGEWTSSRCETRPMGLYLTRRFSFYSEDSTWIGEHNFYADPFCTIPKFIVTAAGHFVLGAPSRILGTTNVDFEIEKATLTVLDQTVIYDMRLPGFCGSDQWEVNVPKELSSTNGCPQLGIILPSMQYDIVKLEMDYKGSCLLFLGQADTENAPTLNVNDRPTAFQAPLTKCGDGESYSQELRDVLYDYNGSQSHSIWSNIYKVILCFLFCTSFL